MTASKTTERGYGHEHQQLRARYKPLVDSGQAYCQQGIPGNGSSGTCLHATRQITPGEPWHLGHNDKRTAYIGPVHADCNQRDGARRGGQAARRPVERIPPPSRETW